MALALILIDALPPTYVSQSTLPSLIELARGCYLGPLQNMYAFRGIEATLFTGLSPSAHGVWGEFRPTESTPSEEPIADRVLRYAVRVGDSLPSDRLRLDARFVLSRLRDPRKRLPTGNLIPPQFIPRFVASVEAPIWEAGCLGETPTLFDELRQAGRSFRTVLYPTVRLDREIPPYVRSALEQRVRPDFWFIKFSALDALGHCHGPDPCALAPALHQLDSQLHAVVADLQTAYRPEGVEIVVLSDHGMSRVARSIDVRPLLKRTGLVPGRDFLYFLDSTTVRFWTHDRSVRETLAGACAETEGMHVVDDAGRVALGVPSDAGAGDVLVALAEGWVVAPDFFRRDGPPRGMHGYASVYTEAGLPCLAAGPSVAEYLPRTRVPDHADVWQAVRRRLISPEEPTAIAEARSA